MSDRFNEGLEQGMQLGTLKERERIDAILDGWEVSWCKCDSCKAVRAIRKEIKGQQ